MATSTVSRREALESAGYVVVEDVFDPEVDFRDLYVEWHDILDGIVDELVAEGTPVSRRRDLPFGERLIAVCAESGRNVPQPFDISLPQKNVHPDTPLHVSATIFRLLTHPRLLDTVEGLIGPEIESNPIQHVRMKLPRQALTEDGAASYLAARVPWHQDWGVLLPEADRSRILSCWIAITDADEENGCLQVIPGSHRAELLNHCPTDPQSSIPDRYLALEDATPLPMRAGSAVFFERSLVHASLDNRTADRVRISMDLRYQPIGQPSGRPQFPSFVARSAERPERVLRDPEAWARMWLDARALLAEEGLPKFTRWDADAPFCA